MGEDGLGGVGEEFDEGESFGAGEFEELGEFFDVEVEGKLPPHFVGNPFGNGAFAAFPVDDGGGGTVEFGGEFVAGEFALFAQVAELVGGDLHEG